MLGFLHPKKSEGWLSIVSGDGRVDLAHVVRAPGKRPEVLSLESFRQDADLAVALERLKGARNLKAFHSTTLLADTDYRIVQLEAPAVPAEELTQAVRWRLKDAVDFPVDDAAVATLDIPSKDSGRAPSLFAVVAPAAAVGRTMKVFDQAKVPLAAIDIPELAQRNVAALFEENNRGLAFLRLTAGDGLLTITYQGELYLSRHIEVSAKVMAEADDDRRQSLMDRLVIELQRTLDNFDRQYSFISVARLVVACEFAVPGLMPALVENLYVPVSAMELAEVLNFSSVPELRSAERQAQCLPALGAALREGA